jgi:gliding motility-associated-like protein
MKAVFIFIFCLGISTSSLYGFTHPIPAIDTCRIPTLITPNWDGKNDEFVIPCIPVGKIDNKSELYIFNEWGDRVAYYKPYENDWTGTYTSKSLPDGTYFYIFKLTPTTDAQRGYLTIFR